MKITVGVLYTAIAAIEIDVAEVEVGSGLPDPAAVRRLMHDDTPELLRAEQQQLVSVDSVIVNDDEEILIDEDFE